MPLHGLSVRQPLRRLSVVGVERRGVEVVGDAVGGEQCLFGGDEGVLSMGLRMLSRGGEGCRPIR